jgi:phosphoribosylaminoimidazolecarboxamide formyltransferase/IMP cyclohydrolase
VPLALLSVYDKTGIVDFARALSNAGWDLLSSGGTANVLIEAGVPVTDVAEVTGYPAMLGHRVVTLHPAVHGGILADLDDPSHRHDLESQGIRAISLVAVNLYPFASDPSIELIDIGGPALIRAAAKNHAHVAVVTRIEDYGRILADVSQSGSVSDALRKELAQEAFATTVAYDQQIAYWLNDEDPTKSELPERITFVANKSRSLRYGENPHQRAGLYRLQGADSWWDEAVQHGGKELSYLNVYDAEAAWRLVHQFADPACVIVKHANPCGVAEVATAEANALFTAYQQALACDPISAFGGIVALNRDVDEETARVMSDIFTEVIVAPSFSTRALETLSAKKNLRLISGKPPFGNQYEIRSIDGGLLVQTPDQISLDRASWRVVTDRQPTSEQWSDLQFAWVVGAAVSSNAIVTARNHQAFGIGAGQQNRLDSARLAIERGGERIAGGVAASDAFFPFRDGIDVLADAGIVAVIQPGGSVRDDEVIAAANERGIAMVFTAERHFRH